MKKVNASFGLLIACTFALLLICHCLATAQTYSTTPRTKTRQPAATPAPAAQPRPVTTAAPAPSRQANTTIAKTTPAGLHIEDNTRVDRVGGSVFSTGAEDVIVKILPRGQESSVFNRRATVPSASPFANAIYLVTEKPASSGKTGSSEQSERLLGNNREGLKIINLGKIPAGELIFAIRVAENVKFYTGPASRNADGRDHSLVRTYRAGLIEIWFEDAPGPPGADRNDDDWDDVVLQLTGGVADNSAVADLLKMIREQKGEARDAAIAALKELNPKALAQAGIQPTK